MDTKAPLLLYPAEILWAPDSSALGITRSEGYSTGYSIDIYRIGKNEIKRLPDVNQVVRGDFNRRHSCHYKDQGVDVGNEPNIAGLTWLRGSEQLVVVAEVPPVGICQQMEYFGGYLVSLSSSSVKIDERYTPQVLQNRWDKMMGDRLKSDFAELSPEQKASLP
jgi:hypothetical protein